MPKIYTLSSSDQGVFFGGTEQVMIIMIKLPKTIHNDMDDRGTLDRKKEIFDYFLKFLDEN